MKLNKKKSKYIYIIPALSVAIIALVAVIVVILIQKNQAPEPVDETLIYDDIEELTEEEITETKETLEKTATVEVLGYKQIQDEGGAHNVVVVKVTNSGEERTSIAADIVAKDDAGKILDKSSLYAEGIEPGQTYEFNMFVYTTLTAEQLQSAKYEVYKANTYEAPALTE